MKRYFSVLIFSITAMIIAHLLLTINASTPVLQSESEIPTDVSNQFYIMDPVCESELRRYYHLTIGEDYPGDLALVFSDMGAVTVTVEDELLMQSVPTDSYVRIQSVVIPPHLLNPGKTLNVCVYPTQDYNSAREILTKTSIAPYKIMLSTEHHVRHTQTLAMLAVAVTMGIYFMAALMCLTLYLGKRSELYLLELSVISIICLIMSLFTTNIPIMPLSFVDYAFLRPLLSL